MAKRVLTVVTCVISLLVGVLYTPPIQASYAVAPTIAITGCGTNHDSGWKLFRNGGGI